MFVGHQPIRRLTDRWEWSSIARFVPSVYHDYSWTAQAVRRVGAALPALPVSAAYLRVWIDDVLIGCPLLIVADEAMNAPRAAPAVLKGDHPDPIGVVASCGVTVVDDTEQLAEIGRLADQLAPIDFRRHRSFDPALIATVNRLAGPEWVEWLRPVWSGWETEARVHDGAGVTVWVHRLSHPTECIAALTVDQAHDWTSPRAMSHSLVPSRHAKPDAPVQVRPDRFRDAPVRRR